MPSAGITIFTIGPPEKQSKDCPFCREPAMQSPMPYIVPQYGFSSAAWDPPKWSADPELVGSVETVSATFTPAALEGSGYAHIRRFRRSNKAYRILPGRRRVADL